MVYIIDTQRRRVLAVLPSLRDGWDFIRENFGLVTVPPTLPPHIDIAHSLGKGDTHA